MEGKNNAFAVNAYDEKGTTIPCFPKEINIMQGIVVGNAVLPYNISIEAHDSGLEKNVVKSVKVLKRTSSFQLSVHSMDLRLVINCVPA